MLKVNKLDQPKCWFPKQYRTFKTIFKKKRIKVRTMKLCNLKHTEQNWEKLSVRIRIRKN